MRCPNCGGRKHRRNSDGDEADIIQFSTGRSVQRKEPNAGLGLVKDNLNEWLQHWMTDLSLAMEQATFMSNLQAASADPALAGLSSMFEHHGLDAFDPEGSAEYAAVWISSATMAANLSSLEHLSEFSGKLEAVTQVYDDLYTRGVIQFPPPSDKIREASKMLRAARELIEQTKKRIAQSGEDK